ncbi:MAG: XdhC family protein [Planctomycetes bacterium]|nr:XdhC family protein [Planctomycetota bacterium]
MDNIDLFRQAASALEKGRPVALVTVISTTGSTPGKVGYKMLVFGAGEGIAGTVGGGKVEARMIDEAAQGLGTPGSRLFRFILGKTPEDEDGICGGSVEFLIETFDMSGLPLFRELSAVAGHNEGGVLVSLLAPGGSPRKIYLTDPEQITVGTDGGFSEEVAVAIKEAAATGNPGIRVSAGVMPVFVEPLAQPPTVVLCGAGYLSYYIARYAQSVHFRVVVYDEREEYANRERFPEADTVIAGDFDGIFSRVRIDEDSYIVIVTRGHKCDEIVLEQAVRTKAHYIGMIGSRQKTRLLLQKLRAKGVPSELLDRVYSPIGLSIGAVTPQEIALSIVCELVKVRRLGDEPGIGHMTICGREGTV